MENVTLDSLIKHRPDLITADMDGECVMMDPLSGKYFNIGRIGADIWKKTEESISVSDLIVSLMAKYDVSEEQCRIEVCQFLEDAVKKGIMHLLDR